MTRKYIEYSTVLPVMKGSPLGGGFNATGGVLGSCFYIGNTYFMTAGHVVKEIQKSQSAVIAFVNPHTDTFKGALVVDTEVLSSDIGIFKADFVKKEHEDWFFKVSWNKKSLHAFARIRTFGYPYGIHKTSKRTGLIMRFFEGHIVANLSEYEILDLPGDIFSVYEMSFNAQRGLSGAPIFTANNPLKISGVIIGNSKNSMLVLEKKEIDKEKDKETIFESYESLSLGIAVQENQIFQLESTLLDCSIKEHLEKLDLLEK
jgi:hypothetical protein